MLQLNTQLELMVRERARLLSETAEELAKEMRRRGYLLPVGG